MTAGEGEAATFIVGCPRSGTTLLRAMLDSHPEVAVPPEAYFVVPALRRRATFETPDGLDRQGLLDSMRTDPSFVRFGLDDAALEALVGDGSVVNVPSFLAGVYATYAAARGKVRWADKNPSHGQHVPLLSRAFHGSRFVHLVRDGRSVVPSLLDRPFRPNRLGEAAIYWRRRVATARSEGVRLPNGRYCEVHYEDLVADPEPTLRRLCDFLELDYEPSMLDYTSRASEVISTAHYPDTHRGVTQAPTRGLRDWRTMRRHDVQLVEALAGPTLEAFGYERSGYGEPLAVRAEAVAWTVADRGGRAYRTARARLDRRRASAA